MGTVAKGFDMPAWLTDHFGLDFLALRELKLNVVG